MATLWPAGIGASVRTASSIDFELARWFDIFPRDRDVVLRMQQNHGIVRGRLSSISYKHEALPTLYVLLHCTKQYQV